MTFPFLKRFSFATLAITAAVVLVLLTLSSSTAWGDKQAPKRPTFAADIGPFVTMHYLDHAALDNYFAKFDMDKLDPMTLGYGLGSRVLVGPVQISSHLEGWSASTSGSGSDAGVWGLSLVGRMGFTLIRRTFLSVIYFGPGLDYTELNINGKSPMRDFSGWKLGLLGDTGISFEYLFPVGNTNDGEGSFETLNIPIGVQFGYAGEIVTDPWYRRAGRLDGVVKDRFMGWYIRFGINIGAGGYQRSQSSLEFPDEDLWPKTPKRKKRKTPEPEPEPHEENEPERT